MRIDPIGAGKTVADGLAVTTLLASLVNLLPAIAAMLTIIWTMIRIYETKTVQALLGMTRNERADREDAGDE